MAEAPRDHRVHNLPDYNGASVLDLFRREEGILFTAMSTIRAKAWRCDCDAGAWRDLEIS
jgi:hypothetical protein